MIRCPLPFEMYHRVSSGKYADGFLYAFSPFEGEHSSLCTLFFDGVVGKPPFRCVIMISQTHYWTLRFGPTSIQGIQVWALPLVKMQHFLRLYL